MALLLPVLASAQFILDGKITDKSTGLPLAGATVSIGQATAQTSANGEFLFRNLKQGSYELRASFVGYKAIEQPLRLTQNQTLNLQVEQASYVPDEVLVSATRASVNSATTYTNLSKEDIEKNNQGRDLPYLLNLTPSVVITSDAGAGIGYTGIRIRGSDPTRINVTINGIPYNDTESQGTYFVDIPDIASSVDNIQVQRGVGTSTNGAGAFGGSINIQTNTRRDSAYAELSNTFGSFDTWRNTLNFGTGMIRDKFTVDGRLSRIQSDGYIDRAASKLTSYFLSGAYYGKKDLLRANLFSGSEKTYQAWNGIPEAKLENDRTFNEFTYPDQTDNYTQDHYQLLYSHSFNPKLSWNSALHYTHGYGYYEEYKAGAKLSSYGLNPVVVGSTTISKTDLIRRRWLDNDFYGATYSLAYTPSSVLNLTLGGAYNEYKGNHFGQVIWAQYASNGNNEQHYYDGDGFKNDFNVYGKASYSFGKATAFADLQYRNVGYQISGTDKNRLPLNNSDDLSFFNPKVGISYQLDERNNLYASFAIANKEPNRDDYINSNGGSSPRPENLKDIETGYRTSGTNFRLGINGFGMFYKDQLISTGKINDVGEYIRQNVPESNRLGLELDGQVKLANNLSWAATAALSRNRIRNFTSYDDDYDKGGQLATTFTKPVIAFSPSFVGSSELAYVPFSNSEIAFISKYVSRQFLDNTSNSARSIDAFFVNDLRLQHNFHLNSIKDIGVGLLINNIFGERYETNGYTFSYLYGGQYTTENFYYPQAGRNFLLSLNVKF
ncbi:MAG: TonB-dependent receptor [Sphingobacteriaceae bacterium]|nr:TonB-dependent receptor [Sphingobacteriaceae bacterium]